MDWKKVVIFGSLAAGAALFFTGRRPAGVVIAGVGLATFASTNPEKFQELWRRMPEYLEKGSKVVDVAANFLERFAQQSGSGYRNIPAAGAGRY